MTSKSGKRIVAGIAADANVILSAVTGRAALRVFTRSKVAFYTPETVMEEVQRYLPSMASQYSLDVAQVVNQFTRLPVQVCHRQVYEHRLPDASNLIAARDPDDVHLLALALTLNVPVWSNDNDFDNPNIDRLTTAQLLSILSL